MSTVIELPTEFGPLEFFHFSHFGQEGLVAQNRNYESPPFVRVHSSCIFSEAFHAADCDCAVQLNAALKYIGANGGFVIYLYQEGRGLGLKEKIEAISIQSTENVNTAEAFSRLGHSSDPRSYDAVVEVLKELSVDELLLATNNPRKMSALEESGVNVVDRIRLDIETNSLMREYIQQKTEFLGHYEDN